MNWKSSIIIDLLIALLAFCSFTQSQTLEEQCELRLFPGKPYEANYIYHIGSLEAPFEGWAWSNHAAKTGYIERVLPSIRAIEANSCSHCALTVFSTDEHSGQREMYELQEGAVLEFSFDVKSFQLDCELGEFDFLAEDLYDEIEEQDEVMLTESEIIKEEEAKRDEMMKFFEIGVQKSIELAKAEGLILLGEYFAFQNETEEKVKKTDEIYKWNVQTAAEKMESLMSQSAGLDGMRRSGLLYYDVLSSN